MTAISRELLFSEIYGNLTEFIKISILIIFFSLETLFILQKRHPIYHFISISCLILPLTIINHYIFSSPSPTYLVDFSCLKPPNFCRVPSSRYIEHAQMIHIWDEKCIAFMATVLKHSGQSEETYLPPALHYIPPKSGHEEAVKEVEISLFPVFQDLLSKTGISPSEIDILIVSCSGFSPSPSLSSIIINRFSMREDVKNFSFSGMGCSASVLAVDTARNILKTRKNSNVVILSTEVLSTGWYKGKEHAMMVLNCMFRMGSAAILLSNKKEARKMAKYKLVYSLRSQRAFDDKGYYAVMREEDSDGFTGVTLRKDLLQVFGETLRSNITMLGPKLLPYTELILYTIFVIKKYLNKSSESTYVPNFKRVVQHFCLLVSSKSMIREIGKGLKLGEKDMEPALMTLHRFGNQSSSSLWYELGYMEAKETVKYGERVWQLGMGSGLKCNSLVWECIRPIVGEAQRGPWADRIHKYPVSSGDHKTSS